MSYFETIKCNNFEVFNLDYHKKRVIDTIGVDINIKEYIYPPNPNFLKCNLFYDFDGIIEITYNPYVKKKIKSFKLVYDNSIIYDKKATNRDAIDKLVEKKQNCDEIIIVKNNLITDTSIANIAIFYDNKWFTPKTPLLKGTTRERYINLGYIKQKDITVDMLLNAKKIALMNAMIGFDIKSNFDIIT